jgi:signal peptidase I
MSDNKIPSCPTSGYGYLPQNTFDYLVKVFLCYITAMEPKKTKMQGFWELVRFAAIALIIVVPIRAFIAEPFIVSGTSMVPTFKNGDYLIVDKISYELGSPQRGDVVIFRYPRNPSQFFIKRIIGLPGETVDVNSAENVVTITNKEHPNGFTLDQSFIQNIGGIDGHIVLSDSEYYVMGDNRSGNSDSRYWGPVDKSLLVGKAFLRLLPITDINLWPGSHKETQ